MANSKKTRLNKSNRLIWEQYNAKHKDAMFDAKVGDVFAEDKMWLQYSNPFGIDSEVEKALASNRKELIFEYKLLERVTDNDGLPSPSEWKVCVVAVADESAAKHWKTPLGKVLVKEVYFDKKHPRKCFPVARSK